MRFLGNVWNILEDFLEDKEEEPATLKEEPHTVDGLPVQPIDDDDTEDVTIIENCALCSQAILGVCSYHQGMFSNEEMEW